MLDTKKAKLKVGSVIYEQSLITLIYELLCSFNDHQRSPNHLESIQKKIQSYSFLLIVIEEFFVQKEVIGRILVGARHAGVLWLIILIQICLILRVDRLQETDMIRRRVCFLFVATLVIIFVGIWRSVRHTLKWVHFSDSFHVSISLKETTNKRGKMIL